MGRETPGTSRQCFTGTLIGRPASVRPVYFTVKYRETSRLPWRWIRNELDRQDGQLVYQNAPTEENDLKGFIETLNPGLNISLEASEVPATQVWSLTFSAKAADDHLSGLTNVPMGRPKLLARWMALVRLRTPWLAPEHGNAPFSPSRDVVLCSFLRSDGMNLVLLAVGGIDHVLTTIRSNNGDIICAARNDSLDPGLARMVVSAGLDFESAVAAVMYHARRIVRETSRSQGEPTAEVLRPSENVKAGWLQHPYDGLTYCTWNGLGQQLSESLILDALETLKRNNVYGPFLRAVQSLATRLNLISDQFDH